MISFYAGSGSPFAWRVWLSLEYKKLPYDLKMLSFQAGDLKTPEFGAINPRRKVPALVDDGFAIYESAAICDYLEDKYPAPSLWPESLQARAIARRVVAEADNYLIPRIEDLLQLVLFQNPANADPIAVGQAREAMIPELRLFEEVVPDTEFLFGRESLADFTTYPIFALARRLGLRHPQHSVDSEIGPRTLAWMKRVEALPYFAATYPPHWK